MRPNSTPTLHQRCKAIVNCDRAELQHEALKAEFERGNVTWSALFLSGKMLAFAFGNVIRYGGYRK